MKQADFGVVIDGWIVPHQPMVTFSRKEQARVPIMIGSNANETTVFGKESPLATENSWPKTVAQYREWLANEFRELPTTYGRRTRQLRTKMPGEFLIEC